MVQLPVPAGTLDPGTVHTPRAAVRNFGDVRDTFPVTLKIGSVCAQTLQRTRSTGQVDAVALPDWIAQSIWT